jgi:ubiquinone/menaquinone biosynthesis C-methylase UbiE
MRRAGAAWVRACAVAAVACAACVSRETAGPPGDAAGATQTPPGPGESGRRLPQEDLAVLEAPDRDEWQQPDRVMDALAIADGSRVADIGAGSGWFTARLARRVGPNGRVHAEDIEAAWIEYLDRRIAREGLTNVETILGSPDDPRLPAGVAAVLLVNTYAHLQNPTAVLSAIARALGPGGRIGVVDFKNDGAGGPGPPREQRVSADAIERDAAQAGLRLVRRESFLRYQFFVILERKVESDAGGGSRPGLQTRLADLKVRPTS